MREGGREGGRGGIDTPAHLRVCVLSCPVQAPYSRLPHNTTHELDPYYMTAIPLGLAMTDALGSQRLETLLTHQCYPRVSPYDYQRLRFIFGLLDDIDKRRPRDQRCDSDSDFFALSPDSSPAVSVIHNLSPPALNSLTGWRGRRS